MVIALQVSTKRLEETYVYVVPNGWGTETDRRTADQCVSITLQYFANTMGSTVTADLGPNCTIADQATVGHAYCDASSPPTLGAGSTVRGWTIIYDDVVAGDGLSTGHFALIRELTDIGDDVLVGTNTVIDGRTTIGSNVSCQTGVYIPSQTTIGDNVFLGPNAVLTNDPYPLRQDVSLAGPILNDHVSVGANATILPDVTVGERAFIAAGTVVTEDVPAETLAVGNPARHEPLPEQLQGGNDQT